MVPDIGAWAPDGKQVLGNHWNRGGLNYHQIFTWSVHELSPHCPCKHQVLASGWEHGNTWENVYLNGYLWHFNVGYDIWVCVFTICNREWGFWWESYYIRVVFVQGTQIPHSHPTLLLCLLSGLSLKDIYKNLDYDSLGQFPVPLSVAPSTQLESC